MPVSGCLRLVAVLSTAVVLVVAAADCAAAAGAAYQVDTADVSEPGSCKVESWASFAKNGDFIGSTSPDCVVSVFGKPVDFSAQFSRFRSDDEWGTGVFPKAKMNLIPTAIGQLGVAVSGSVAVDLITGDLAAWFLTAPLTYRFSDTLRMNVNLGYARDRKAEQDYFTYGVGFDLRTPDNVWTLTAEVFGIAGTITEEQDRGQIRPRWQVGLRWRPIDDFNLDVIYGRNLTGEDSNWITVATVFRVKVGGKGDK
ncbi:MAG: hypothetical protein ABWY35_02425 [Pseudorhodoplanes sp.]